ncbi:hypothetical protein GR268_46665, partial [Rhizobium leguminosarum]|nr:hypothetical protein [Rhizobium leguminosarum]
MCEIFRYNSETNYFIGGLTLGTQWGTVDAIENETVDWRCNQMTEGLKASKLAEALNKAAESFVPKSKGTLAAQLEDPEVKEAIINMR